MKAFKAAAASLIVAVSLFTNLITVISQAYSAVSFTVAVYSYTENRYIFELTELTYDEQVSPINVLSQLDGAEVEISGGYVKSAFGLKERAYGAESGWVYMINGMAPPISAAQYKLRSGDRLDWIYLTSNEQYGVYPPGSSSPSDASSGGNSTAVGSISSQPYTSSTTLSEPSASSAYTQSGGSTSYQPSHSSSHTPSYPSQIDTPSASSNSVGSNIEPETSSEKVTSKEEAVSEQQSPEYGEKIYDERIEAAVNKSIKFLKNNPGAWSALAILSAGADISGSVKELAEDEYNSAKASDNITSKISALLNCAASGSGADYKSLAEEILNSEKIYETGVNGPIFALILLCETGVEDVRWSKDALADLIVEYQHENGGFSLAKDIEPDADITAMAVTALSTAGLEEKAASMGIEYLASIQNDDGSMSSMGISNCESTAQTLIALISSGRDVYDESFIKNGNSLVDALLQFECADGFTHIKSSEADIMATEQALMALSAVKSGKAPYSGIFDNASSQDDSGMADVAAASDIIAIMLAVLAAAGVICYKKSAKENKADKS